VNIDHLHVGWYQSTFYGSFVSRALLDSQFSYQHAIEESIVLIYGTAFLWQRVLTTYNQIGNYQGHTLH